MNYYLAVDIGASSGRHILSHLENGKIVLEEIYRFPNGVKEKDGHLVWDVDALFSEILTGMKMCAEQNKIPYSMGIDTWGVDFVLLDKEEHRLGDAISYRDDRTKGMDEKVYEIISENNLYERTGIQKQLFNTIYQLMAIQKQQPELMEKAESLLLIPDYFHYLLTGVKVTEYTNASTTQLLSPKTKEWDLELMKQLGYSSRIFQEIKHPGEELGNLLPQIQKEVGFDCKVVLPATHDTGSAVMAVPSVTEGSVYISSGTWSLMGTELIEANTSVDSRIHNFTNEGGYDYRFRYLKNIMGMWMINSVKNEIASEMTFPEICECAEKANIDSVVEASDDRFLAPKSMVQEVQKACEESGQEVPNGIGEIAKVIYQSLAKCYADTVNELEECTGIRCETIHIIGGGANASYLNRLTAKAAGLPVLAGPMEATAIGNIVAQLIAANELSSLLEARKCIYESFPMETFQE